MTSRSVSLLIVLISAFFPLVYLIELGTPVFWAPFIEESLARFIPLLIVYIIINSRHPDPLILGIIAGVTFGILEIFTKILTLGYFSILMLVPFFAVHLANGVVQSFGIYFSVRQKAYVLLPVIYIITVMWHWLYNAYLYVV